MGNETTNAKTFRFEVDLEAVAGDPAEELGRILRYWAGNLKHYEAPWVSFRGQGTAGAVTSRSV